MLDYTPPSFEGHERLDAVIRVDGFSVSDDFDTTAMVYRTGYETREYNYGRWRANPADIVTGHLLNDLASSSLFEAVLPYSSTRAARFVLDGRVERFYESDDGQAKAVLRVSVTLSDNGKDGAASRVLFQKVYEEEKPIADKTPEGLAAAMSDVMEAVSGRIISDVYDAAAGELKG